MTSGCLVAGGGLTIPYDITFSSRRKTISIIVHRTKRVEIKAPSGTPVPYIHDLAKSKLAWIVKRLGMIDSMPDHAVERKYCEQEIFYFLGTPLSLVFERVTGSGTARKQGESLIVGIPGSVPVPDHSRYARKLVQEWYRGQGSRIIAGIIREYADLLGLDTPSFRIRNVRRRWGSCNHRNNLNFNSRLIMAPVAQVEYVVMHELCHVRHKNHSGTFWKALQDVMPDYRERREQLRREGYRYIL